VLGLDNRLRHGRTFASISLAPSPQPPAATPAPGRRSVQLPRKRQRSRPDHRIIELGGGYRQADLAAYFKTLARRSGDHRVSVDGGKNKPSTASGADGEVMLDVEVAASVAPGAKVAVYFTPNTDQGFLDAITTAVHDAANKPSVISISWAARSRAGPRSR